ncbi:cytoplasmic protein [candidate division WOR-3 bacterium]|nr:cytoplasmic protein [candidate division WOR-3 bacterium]
MLYCDLRDCIHLGYANRLAEALHTCRAFPKGIPWDIVIGKVKHTEVLPGQTGDCVLTPGPEDQRAGDA